MTIFVTYSNTANNNSIRIIYTDGTSLEVALTSTNGEKTTYRLVTSNNKQVESIILGFYANGQTTVYYDESGFFEGVVASEDFVQYSGTTYDIAFPSEVGTVYGGSLDVTNGVLTVNRASVDLGTLSWSKDNNNFWYTRSVKLVITGSSLTEGYRTNAISDKLVFGGYSSPRPRLPNTSEFYASGMRFLEVWNNSVTAGSELKALLSGVQFVYELATPITYQLTPQEITTLAETNYLWSDSGDISATYT